jgi:hypothetical protein
MKKRAAGLFFISPDFIGYKIDGWQIVLVAQFGACGVWQPERNI